MFTVYVIESKEGYRYTGYTSDIKKRLDQHNSGISKWTRRGSNWKIIYSEDYADKSEAIKREAWLKTGVGRDFINSNLNDL